ncbi:MAG: efflux RND transporter periplasmic adaptor subunit [Gammaproteobacteria bacterium]|nr:efflux RND transporter periplasmic adaptor subunit [Gammaproteobacteria bacterium]
MKMLKFLTGTLALAVFVCGFGCSFDTREYSKVIIEPRDYHEFFVRAHGEIISTQSDPVQVGGNVRAEFTIAWMIPEYSEVKAGDVVVRFDNADMVQVRDRSLLQLERQQSSIDNFINSSFGERIQLGHEDIRVDGEIDIAAIYTLLDDEVFSRNELIDQVGNLEYLRQLGEFIQWQIQTHDRRHDAEITRLEANLEATEQQFETQQETLNNMEIKSPSDGTFIYGSTWWGTKYAPGQTVWRNSRVGEIPVKGMIQARLHVLEVDAIGVEVGQTVRMWLHSALDQEITGKIVDISHIAAARDQVDPTKYFTVSVDIDNIDADLMRVGSTIEAEVVTGELENAYLIPQQAVYIDKDRAYVYVIKNREPERRYVELGHSSPTLIEVVSGLEAGEAVSLEKPDELDEADESDQASSS